MEEGNEENWWRRGRLFDMVVRLGCGHETTVRVKDEDRDRVYDEMAMDLCRPCERSASDPDYEPGFA